MRLLAASTAMTLLAEPSGMYTVMPAQAVGAERAMTMAVAARLE
jgi:hypothetical protein